MGLKLLTCAIWHAIISEVVKRIRYWEWLIFKTLENHTGGSAIMKTASTSIFGNGMEIKPFLMQHSI